MGKKETWNKLMNAFSGRGTFHASSEYPEVPLDEMVRTLSNLTEGQWGRYAFSREPLEGKFNQEQKIDYTARANECGRQWADRMAAEYGTRSPILLAQKMGMEVKTPKTPSGGGLVLFAQFVQPNEITIFTDCIEKGQALAKECDCPLLEDNMLMNVLLAHELFHAVEEQHEKEIYTRTEKVELWRKPFSNRSKIACLSEIAAMAFAGHLLDLEISPYLLDVVLVYAYDKKAAWGLYDEICSLND